MNQIFRILFVCSTLVLALSCEDTDEPDIIADEPVKFSVNTGVYYSFPENISNFYFKEAFYGDKEAIGFAVATGKSANRLSNFYKYSPNDKTLWNWEVAGQAPSGYNNAIHAINEQIILLGVQTPNPLISRSEDGGATWTEVYRAPEEDKYYFNPGKFFFANESVGFAYEGYVGIGSGPKPDRQHFIIRTDDGGLSWHKIMIGEFVEGYDSPAFETIILDMTIIDGKLVATGDHTLYSDDLGITWTHIPSANGRSYGIGKSATGLTILGGYSYSTDMLSADMEWVQYPADSLPKVEDNGCFTCNRGINAESMYVWQNTVALFGSNKNFFSVNGGGRWDNPTSGNIMDITSGSAMPLSHSPSINKSPVEGTLYYLGDNADRTTSIYRMEIKPE